MFSTTCQYAKRAVLYLALHTNGKVKIGVDVLAQLLDIPKHFLAKILQQLARHKLISSSKGRNGGFYLSDENKDAKLISIIYAIDGPEKFETCILGLKECSGKTPCPYHEYVAGIRTNFLSKLKTETIRESADRISLKDLSLKL